MARLPAVDAGGLDAVDDERVAAAWKAGWMEGMDRMGLMVEEVLDV